MSAAIELTAGADLVTFDVKKEDLKGFTMKELRDTREAMVLVGDVLGGLLNQSRYITYQSRTFNAAGDVLDLVQTLTSRIADAIEDEAASRSEGLSKSDATARAFLLMMAMAEREDLESPGPSLGVLTQTLEGNASAPADPLLRLVTEYRTKLDVFNAAPTTTVQEDIELEAKTWGPSYAVLTGGDVPNATTLPGAMVALRELHREFVDCGGADAMAIAVLPSVVAFFDAEGADAMRQRAARVEGASA